MQKESDSLPHLRLKFKPKISPILKQLKTAVIESADSAKVESQNIASLFPNTYKQKLVRIVSGSSQETKPLRVGVLLSGGQAPGGHNVISGLFDALIELNPSSHLIGFLNGPSGLIANQAIPITSALVDQYRNQGGFDMIGSSRTKVESEEQFKAALNAVNEQKLDGLVVVGGDDSNTNAALLAEYFIKEGCSTKVVGIPKTIDGDLQSDLIDISFGFDTACKVYEETIGNLMRDGLSAKKYYYFIKLMGRSASHITLECALKTHPNCALISEEAAAKKQTLTQIVDMLCDIIVTRAQKGKNYGVFLIPEGLIEFIPEINLLISELNALLAHHPEIDKLEGSEQKIDGVANLLSFEAKLTFNTLPKEIKAQLLLVRDPHGNVQVSKVETECLLVSMVKSNLKKRTERGGYTGKFDAITHFCGYEGRSALPSNFDSQYCYALGRAAAVLLQRGATGFICYISGLKGPVDTWGAGGIPLTQLMHLEKRGTKDVPVISKTLVNLDGNAFKSFAKQRDGWLLDDSYCAPGPIQFFGPEPLIDSVPITLRYTEQDRKIGF